MKKSHTKLFDRKEMEFSVKYEQQKCDFQSVINFFYEDHTSATFS